MCVFDLVVKGYMRLGRGVVEGHARRAADIKPGERRSADTKSWVAWRVMKVGNGVCFRCVFCVCVCVCARMIASYERVGASVRLCDVCAV